MVQINWLHLTDLHRGMKEGGWLWPSVRESFFDDLKRLHDKCGPWDLVLFTGDLAQRGQSSEFEQVDHILAQLWKLLRELGSDPKLLAVPGNHDLVRPDLRIPAVKLLLRWTQELQVQEEFWDSEDSPFPKLGGTPCHSRTSCSTTTADIR